MDPEQYLPKSKEDLHGGHVPISETVTIATDAYESLLHVHGFAMAYIAATQDHAPGALLRAAKILGLVGEDE